VPLPRKDSSEVEMPSFGGSLAPPPCTVLSAACAFTSPAPQPSEHLLLALAVLLRMFSTCVVFRLGFTASMSATTPATCGVAMLVPWLKA
jgi:hypothetical protein